MILLRVQGPSYKTRPIQYTKTKHVHIVLKNLPNKRLINSHRRKASKNTIYDLKSKNAQKHRTSKRSLDRANETRNEYSMFLTEVDHK